MGNSKRRPRPALLAILGWLLAAPPASSRPLVDDLGFRVNVKGKIHRVVSLVPTNSEMVCLLDCAKLVGGTRHDAFPEELRQRIESKQIGVIGGGYDANLEKIVQLQPDLVLTNGPSQQRYAVPLKNLGFTVVSLWPRDLDGLVKDFALLGTLLGQEAKANRLVDDMHGRFRSIVENRRGRPTKRAYLQMWSEPLITIGGASFTDWLVRAAGAANIFADLPFDSAQIGLESLIQRDPEVLIFLADQKSFVQSLSRRPGWSALRAVRAGSYCFIEEPDIRRSIRFVDGLAKLQDCMGGISPEPAR